MRGFSALMRGRRRSPAVMVLAIALLIMGAAPVLAMRVPTDPEPDIACADGFGSGMLTHYATTVQTPADSDEWWVSVEFTLTGADASCTLALATYELASGEFTYPQSLYDSDGGTFGAGTHVLTAALPVEGDAPGCWSQYDFVFGAAIEELTFENRYDTRQIRARIAGSAECPEEQVATASPTPSEDEGGATATATASPTPREDTAGGNPTPPGTGGTLPDTSAPASSSGPLAAMLGLVMLASLIVATTWRVATEVRRR